MVLKGVDFVVLVVWWWCRNWWVCFGLVDFFFEGSGSVSVFCCDFVWSNIVIGGVFGWWVVYCFYCLWLGLLKLCVWFWGLFGVYRCLFDLGKLWWCWSCVLGDVKVDVWMFFFGFCVILELYWFGGCERVGKFGL